MPVILCRGLQIGYTCFFFVVYYVVKYDDLHIFFLCNSLLGFFANSKILVPVSTRHRIATVLIDN